MAATSGWCVRTGVGDGGCHRRALSDTARSKPAARTTSMSRVDTVWGAHRIPSAWEPTLGGVMRRLTLVVVAVLAAAFAGAASAHEASAPTRTVLQSAEHQAGGALNMELVGHNDIGGRGYNADVWVHEGHAYVGSW